jgi:hypothetical protein
MWLVVAAGLVPAVAKAGEPQQFYGEWKSANHYFYRTYNSTDAEGGLSAALVLCYKADRRYYYWYNETKKFWGRCESSRATARTYSLLAEGDRKSSLKDIPETAFPAEHAANADRGGRGGKWTPSAMNGLLPPDEPPPSFTAGKLTPCCGQLSDKRPCFVSFLDEAGCFVYESVHGYGRHFPCRDRRRPLRRRS